MRPLPHFARSGVVAVALAIGIATAGAAAQSNVRTPPPRDNLPQNSVMPSNYVPGVFVDPDGTLHGYCQPVQPVRIPYDGVCPAGTFLHRDREAEPRPHLDVEPWIPDGTGYWPPVMDDLASPQTQPLMQDFDGPGPTDRMPPDPDLARGYDYQVCVVNRDFGVYDSCGNLLFYRDIREYLGIEGHFFDPKVIFDPWAGRWVMMYHFDDPDTSPPVSRLYLLVTGNAIPFGLPGSDVWYYPIDALQVSGLDYLWADYFDLGYSNTVIAASGNMFNFSDDHPSDDEFFWARIIVFNKSEMYAHEPVNSISWWSLTNDDGSTTTTPRSCKLQTSWSEGGLNVDAMFCNSRSGGGNRITFWKVRSAFVLNLLGVADTVVGNYTLPPNAIQPNGVPLDTLNCRLMPAVVTYDDLNNHGIELFTSLNAAYGSDCRTLLYKFDAVSHALEFERLFGRLDADYWFACPAADFSGSNFWAFSRTSYDGGVNPEIRAVDYNRGTFSGSSFLVKSGEGCFNDFRWGDYFGGQLDWGDYSNNYDDPGMPAKVWLYAEYGLQNGYDTHVGASSVFPQGSISAVTPSTVWDISGPPGGPFSHSTQSYAVSSAPGDVGTAFEVIGFPIWLDASRTYSQLWTDSIITMNVNSHAGTLSLGTYTGTISFAECYNDRTTWNRAVQLRVMAPDLEVRSCLVADGTYNPGDTISVRGVYRNNGNLPTGDFQADFYASKDTIISPSDTYLGSRSYASLDAGASMNYGAHLFILPCMPEGNRYIGVIATVTGDADTSDNLGHDATPIGYEYCGGDFNGDCIVNTEDLLDFLTAWAAGDLSTDCNGDGVINTLDFLCFLNAWSGCR